MNDITSDDNTTEKQSPECSDANDGKQDCLVIPKGAAFARPISTCLNETSSSGEKGESKALTPNERIALDSPRKQRRKEEQAKKELRRKERKGDFNKNEDCPPKTVDDNRGRDLSDSAEDCEDNDAENGSSENHPDSREPLKPLTYEPGHANGKVSKTLNKQNGFIFIPAGADPAKFRHKGIHYRYLDDNEIDAYDEDDQFFRTGNLLLSCEKPPSEEGWRYINLDIFDPACSLQSECMPCALGSAYYLLKMPGMFKEGLRNDNLLYYPDSGAYQDFRFDDGFRELRKLAELYIKCAHMAFTLDFIPSADDHYDEDRMRLMATAQKYSTDILKKYLSGSSVKLINIIHGNGYPSLKQWADIVYDPDISDYACGFDGRLDFRVIAPIIAELFYNREATSIHLLGKSSHSFVPVMCLIGKYGRITSDGSSLLVNTFRNRRFLSLTPQGKLIDTPMGKNSGSHFPRHSAVSSVCGCPVCREIPLYDVYKAPDKFNTQALLAFHNCWTFNEFVNYWNELAATLSIEEYVKAYVKAFGGRGRKNRERISEMALYVDNFLSLARDKGVERALRVYRQKLCDWGPDEYRHIPLFHDDSVGDDLSPDESDDSSIYRAAKYLPNSVLRELGFSPKFLAKKPKTAEPEIVQEAKERFEELGAVLEDNECLIGHFGNDVCALWKKLRKVVVEKRRRCLINPSHSPKIKRADGSVSISCSACGYKIKI